MYTLGTCLRTTGIQVYTEVLDWFKRHTYLQILRLIRGGRGGDIVGHQQPVVFYGFVYETVTGKTEGEVKSWCQHSVTLLSEHITGHRHKARYCHGVLLAIRQTDVPYEHQSTGNHLCGLIPRLLFKRSLRSDGEFQLRCGIHL